MGSTEEKHAAGTSRTHGGHDLAAVAGSTLHADDYAGSGKLVIDADREVIVGAALVGPDVGELLHAATIAVVGEVRSAGCSRPGVPHDQRGLAGPAGPAG